MKLEHEYEIVLYSFVYISSFIQGRNSKLI